MPNIADDLATRLPENTHVVSHESKEKEPGKESVVAAQETCTHLHSMTGDFGMILRLLPDYTGGQPQPGYMLDICKGCLKELPERPYSKAWPLKRH